MLNAQRLEFITRHFNDLQTIRFAPIPLAMLFAPVARRMPHIGTSAARAALVVFSICGFGFYRWSTVAIHRRYGSVRVSRVDAPWRSALRILMALGVLWFGFFDRGNYADFYISATIFVAMLSTILDRTNPLNRRLAWSIGLVVLLSAGLLLVGADGGAAIFSAAGAVWLSLSLFDFLLLRRTFAEISATPPNTFGDEAVHYG